MRTVIARFALVLAVPVLFGACVDFGVDNEKYVCRDQSECGSGFECLRHDPDCYCTCQPFGSTESLTCEDPRCEKVATE